MKNFKREERSGGERRGGFSRRTSGDRPEMHEATCSDCGKRCEVPFKPTGDKPIYCSQCFGSHDRNAGAGERRAPSRERRSFSDRQMFEATCDNCGKRCELPFKPSGDKPVYCSQCFEKGGNTPMPRNNESKEQLEEINIKLDRILKLLLAAKDSQKEEKGLMSKLFPINNKD